MFSFFRTRGQPEDGTHVDTTPKSHNPAAIMEAKAQGEACLKDGRYVEAVRFYTEAMDLLDLMSSHPPAAPPSAILSHTAPPSSMCGAGTAVAISILLDRATAKKGVGDKDGAKADVKRVLVLQAGNPRALDLLGQLQGKGQEEGSLDSVTAAAAPAAERDSDTHDDIDEEEMDYEEIVEARRAKEAGDARQAETGQRNGDDTHGGGGGSDSSPWLTGWVADAGFTPPGQVQDSDGSNPHVLESVQREEAEEVVDEHPPTLRHFTPEQLAEATGRDSADDDPDPGGKSKGGAVILMAIEGDVYDVTTARELYGPGAPYHFLAGHEVCRALAKSSKEICDLDSRDLQDLSQRERMTLSGWKETFAAKSYPVIGKLIQQPAQGRVFTRKDLRDYTGQQACIPEGCICAPIYVAVKESVFDVSFGGLEMYGEGGPYHCLAGRDASRVLARMSMKPEDIEGTLDYSCLTEKEAKNLNDWERKLRLVKKYPVVGTLNTYS